MPIGAIVAIAGCIAGIIPALHVLVSALPVKHPAGILVDQLSAFFLFIILFVSALCALFAARTEKRPVTWFFFNLLVASMALTVCASDTILFLISWETMSLASFVLVIDGGARKASRDAGWIYFVATHLGTAFIIIMFMGLGAFPGANGGFATVALVCALIGFGTKAGMMPFHVWLPEAHPAAPGFVSALMSGVMIKTGIYGLLRAVTLAGGAPEWFGWLLIVAGLVSGVFGVVYALAQHDLKRLLAYHSVENIGIILLGLGTGFVGLSRGNTALAVLGLAGGLFHVLNHAVFKGLLFLGAGAVHHATGTREMDALGGLIKKMPWTAFTFLVGAVAISGLPPLNGFASEFMIYFGSFGVLRGGDMSLAGIAAVSVAGLALIGGLAAACFAKAFGIVFLGEPRTKQDQARPVTEAPPEAVLAMAVLAASCVLIALLAPLGIHLLAGPVSVVFAGGGIDIAQTKAELARAAGAYTGVAGIFALLLIFTALAALLRHVLLRGRRVEHSAVTWDCGYHLPSPRMQYTASSFAQPLVSFFRTVTGTLRAYERPTGYFPGLSRFSTRTGDLAWDKFFAPVFSAAAAQLGRLRFLQQGGIHLYVFMIMLALVALLIRVFW